MIKFTLRRVIQAIPTIIGVTILSMVIMILAPGNPASQLMSQNPDMTPAQREAMIEAMGVNAPIHEQYARWLIGDAPVTFGPLGFGLVTIGTCKEDFTNPNADHVPNPACEGVMYRGKVSVEEGTLLVGGEPTAVNGVVQAITGADLDATPDNTLTYNGQPLNLNEAALDANNRDLDVQRDVVKIRNRDLMPDDLLLVINNEIVSRNGNIATSNAELLFVDGAPLSILTTISHATGGVGLKVDEDGNLTYRGDTITYPEGFFTITEDETVLRNGEEVTRDDDLIYVDGQLYMFNDEPALEGSTVQFTDTRIEVRPDGSVFDLEGQEIDLSVPIYSVLRSEMSVSGGALSFISPDGETIPVNVDGEVVTLVEEIIRVNGRTINPDTAVTLLNDDIIAFDGTIAVQDNLLPVIDGEVWYDDLHIISGTTLWGGQVTLWAGREIPVFDRQGNIIDYQVGGHAQGVLRGDFGQSLISQRPVMDVLTEKLPATVELGLLALLFGTLIGLPVGVLAAVYQGSWFDQVTRIGAVVVSAIPVFWLGLILLVVFGVWLDLLPMGNRFPVSVSGEYTLWDRIAHLILPVFTLSSFTIATFSRFMRASLLDVLNRDYIRTARAKGLSNRRTWFTHGMRNALIPIATIFGPALTGVISGAVLTETIYSWPGMGRFVIESVQQQDYPVIMATVILFSIATVIGFLISDLLYAALDPRIRLS